MPKPSQATPQVAPKSPEGLDMPEERRTAALAHVALLAKTVHEVERTLPLQADEADFAAVLEAEARS